MTAPAVFPTTFQRVGSPAEAVDRLATLYAEATQALREAVERFLREGVPPSPEERARFRYPALRLTYLAEGPRPVNARAFAKKRSLYLLDVPIVSNSYYKLLIYRHGAP